MLSGEWLEPCQASSMRSPPMSRRAAVLEGLLGRRPGRVVVAQQQRARLLVPDANDVPVEQRGGAGVVGVVVRVDEVGDLVAHAVGGGDLVDGALDVVADGRRRVEQHDAVRGGQERRLVGAVGDPVEVPLDPSDVVALLVERRAERRLRDRRVVGQARRRSPGRVSACASVVVSGALIRPSFRGVGERIAAIPGIDGILAARRGWSHPGNPWSAPPVTRPRSLAAKPVRELRPRLHAELAEHLAQVVLDGAGADEQLRGDLAVRVPVARPGARSAPPGA